MAELQIYVGNNLGAFVRPDNVLQYLRFADRNKLGDLKMSCLKTASTCMEQLVKGRRWPTFRQKNPKLVDLLFQSFDELVENDEKQKLKELMP